MAEATFYATAGCTLREIQDSNFDGGVGGVSHYYGMETKDYEAAVATHIDFSALVADADISAATFSVYAHTLYEEAGLHFEDYEFYVRECLQPWVTDEAKWSEFASGQAWGEAGAKKINTDISGAYLAFVAGPADPGWWDFDVTAWVQYLWGQDKIFDVVMDGYQALIDVDAALWMKFYGYNQVPSTQRPKLVITYTSAGGTAFIKEISGVPWADVKEVSGVAEASISEVSGVTAN